MNSEPVVRELAEPNLRRLLSTAGLDVEYVRASGNTLYRKGANGEEIPVLDYAAGYGALIFGHNHPDIVAHARELLDEQTPVLAQFSSHPYANRLAAELNRIIHRETGSDEPYYATFANSGAEGIEVALKHAELDRVMRLSKVFEEIEASARRVRETVRAGAATVPDTLWTRLGLPRPTAEQDVADLLIEEIARRNQLRRGKPPVFVALKAGFHGKLMGSVQLTHNESYRTPFAALGAQARFVPCDRPEALKEVLQEERGTLLEPAVQDGTVRLVERDHHTICAFLLEPIQGEGGIRPLSAEFAQEVEAFAEEADCPVVIDEIQSGLGRTGTFLGATRLGLRGDYYVFAKSLGGGIAKASVTLVREGRYRPEFELLHSSTFAKDSFSCHIALKVLDMLEADGGRGYRLARERGTALAGMLHGIRSDFPDVVKEVRGHGLMLGFEFHDQSDAADDRLREAARSSLFGYVVAGHLLHAHDIRTFPTASAVHTLRFEPSVLLTDEEIDRLEHALRDVCALVRDQAGDRLVLVS
ncbi:MULTISPECIES: aspartate aminotransferase family protein [unclassified Streptomyces]|uniref:aspartate aminotransferase family protein n=1 Tax=unclassified Streptomyces TaxID=2593676 RepID=UPI0008EFBA4A|nr:MULTISPECIES: aminotransferase class III-fold pyridoxal phosphate-dependent enzyme [unclassified Streptomyces]UJV40093.1 aspartate aminotransferase family protein [Streptomyces sp. AMCC400023]SFN28660.1 Acetylornithine/succinyldiaminopimelate/putrescine aminotransferase [Streptomyces sp. cf124]